MQFNWTKHWKYGARVDNTDLQLNIQNKSINLSPKLIAWITMESIGDAVAVSPTPILLAMLHCGYSGKMKMHDKNTYYLFICVFIPVHSPFVCLMWWARGKIYRHCWCYSLVQCYFSVWPLPFRCVGLLECVGLDLYVYVRHSRIYCTFSISAWCDGVHLCSYTACVWAVEAFAKHHGWKVM